MDSSDWRIDPTTIASLLSGQGVETSVGVVRRVPHGDASLRVWRLEAPDRLVTRLPQDHFCWEDYGVICTEQVEDPAWKGLSQVRLVNSSAFDAALAGSSTPPKFAGTIPVALSARPTRDEFLPWAAQWLRPKQLISGTDLITAVVSCGRPEVRAEEHPSDEIPPDAEDRERWVDEWFRLGSGGFRTVGTSWQSLTDKRLLLEADEAGMRMGLALAVHVHVGAARITPVQAAELIERWSLSGSAAIAMLRMLPM